MHHIPTASIHIIGAETLASQRVQYKHAFMTEMRSLVYAGRHGLPLCVRHTFNRK